MGKVNFEKWRLITPMLVTIVLFFLAMLLNDMKELKLCFSNHLEHHRQFEVLLADRLGRLEERLNGR